MTRPAQAKLLIVAVFAVGLVAGAVLSDLYTSRVEPAGPAVPPTGRPFERFEDFLGLTDEQQTQVDAILRETGQAFNELRAETRPMYREIRERARDEIRGILTEEQRVLYEEWVAQLDSRRGSARRQP